MSDSKARDDSEIRIKSKTNWQYYNSYLKKHS